MRTMVQLCVLAVLVLGTPAIADTVTFQQGDANYTGTQDTYLYQSGPDTIEGEASTWRWDTDDPPNSGLYEYGLVRFDNIFGAGAGQIPVGATIIAATLTIYIENGTVEPAGSVNEVAVDWTETAATWNNFGGDAGVQTDEYRATPQYSAPIATGTVTVDVTASLQGWSTGARTNYGWIFRPAVTDGVAATSSEGATVANRPKLIVEYTAPCDGPEDCNDNDLCTIDTCESLICVHTPKCPSGQTCDPLTGECLSSPGFTAYNDCVYSSVAQQTDPEGVLVPYLGANVTTYSIGTNSPGPSSGVLLDQATGNPTGVTVTLTQSGGVIWNHTIGGDWSGGYTTHAGTDARTTFGGIADITGVVYYGSTGWWVDATFTGLNPQKTYTFATSASRANSSYTTRITRFTLSGADSATNASTAGVQEYNGDPLQVYFNTGDNHTDGYVARWTQINPGADGSFTVRAQAHSANQAYAFSVFMLEEAGEPCDGPEDCNDDNVCTSDDCVGEVCTHDPVSGPCDDGDLCTTGDTCVAGACVGTPKCPPGSTCDPETGECLSAPQTVTFQQGTAGYAGEVDTYLEQGNPDTGHASTTPLMIDGSPVVQALLRFGQLFVSDGGPIPDGATIISASLTINVTNISTDGAELFRMLVPWADTATWNSMTGGIQADNVEAVSTYDAKTTYNTLGTWTFDVTPSLAAWSAGATNYGWAWLPPSGGTDSWQFDSAEGATVANRPLLSVTFSQPGPEVVLVAPADGATNVSAHPTLSVTVTDPQSDPLDVSFYGREVGGTVPADFTIVHITDTQFCSESAPDVYRAQMQWVNSNQAALNIVHLIHTGDITNVDVENQWVNADSAMDLLEAPLPGLPYGVPYGILPGNHDSAPGSTLLYNQYFGVSRFSGRPYYGGHYGSTNNANYTLFSGGGMDFIAVQLHMQPDSAMLDWADAVLKANPNRRAIVSSHYIMEVGENAPMSSTGLAIYNALKDNPNLFLMLCGHMHGEGKRYDDFEGRRVWTMIADYQEVQSGHSGYMRLLKFSPADNKIYVQTYSPTANGGAGGYLTGATSQFDLDYEMNGSGPFTLIDSFFDVVSDDQVDLPWPGRASGKTYEWYVEVSDGVSTTVGPTWSFTSNGACTSDTDCDDGLFCNGVEDCPDGGGTCIPGTYPCGEQLCNETTDACVACVNNDDCRDSDLCTTDTCVGGSCQHTEIDCSALDDDCNEGVCDPSFGVCVVDPLDNGTPCSDDLTCTINDQCVSGTCVGTDDCAGDLVCNPQTNSCTMPTPTVSFQEGASDYAGTVDTYLREQAPSTAHGSLDWIEWDASESTSNQETLGLLRFEQIFGDAYGKIPVGAEILSATLELYVYDSGDSGSVRPALVAWDETTTYNDFGGDAGAQPDEYGAQVALVGGGSGLQTVDVTASIQAWADNPATNRGWLILHTGSAGTGVRSSEYATADQRPKLTVTFRATCGSAADCDDNNECTNDACVSEACEYTNVSGSCDDGNICTINDTCSDGRCTGVPKCPSGQTCDPVTGECALAPTAEPLPIEPGDTWRYFKGTAEPPTNWTTLLFDDSGWLQGPGGFGYGTDCDPYGTVLNDMLNGYVSLYTRRLFHLDDPELISRLILTVDYDDGFVAYINGVEVVRRNIAGTPPAHTDLATVDHECSGGTSGSPAEVIELSEINNILMDNSNVLAIQAHNLTAGSSDFTLTVSLTAIMAPTCVYDSDCNDGIACTADACVNGDCVSMDDCPAGQTCNHTTGICETPTVDPLPIEYGDSWKYFKGTIEPPAGWNTAGFDDSAWLEGPSGLGYDYYVETGGTNGNGDYGPFIGTELTDMRGCTPLNPPLCNSPGYVSVYMRKAFTVTNPAAVTSLTFRMYADDGYVAYLNGTEVARIRVTGTPPAYSALATGGPSVAPPVEQTLDLTSLKGLLVSGMNVLAVQGHNATLDSRDFLMIPQLSSTGGCTSDAECDDGNPCTDDTCNVGTGVCSNTNDNTNSCTDNIACTTDACIDGDCVSTDSCPAGQACNPTTGECESGPQTLTFQQGVNGYSGTADTYIDAALVSQATTTPIVCDGSPAEHILIRFDGILGSGANQIPVGSTIVSATLTLRVGPATDDPSNSAVNFHRLLHPWVDTDVWAAYGVAPWNATGGIQADGVDALAAIEATATMSTASTAYPVSVTASVQAWVLDPSSNYGWAILPTGNDGLRLESSESTTASYRPLLSVTYMPPGPQCELTSQLASATAAPGGAVDLDVFVHGAATVRGYQTKIAITRTSGSGSLTVNCPGGVMVDESRADYIFQAFPPENSYPAVNCTQLLASSALLSGGAVVDDTPAYLSTYTLTVSPDASQGATFDVALVASPGSYLYDNTPGTPQPIPFTLGPVQVLTVGGVANDNCAQATPVVEGSYAFDTTYATFDGPGHCMVSPSQNVWFCYTATVTGQVTISLAATWSTMLAVYHDCTCYPTQPMMMGCNPTTCTITVQQGHGYLIEVGGTGTAAGPGTLNIVAVSGCNIGGVPYNDGDLNPANSCEECDPLQNPSEWSPVDDGTPCSDGLYCTETDLCQAGVCVPGNDPCGDVCERCSEVLDACEHCMFDLEPDANGRIGGGDFGIFAGDFGGCYAPGDPRLRSNFDGSTNGCVGGGDFGLFSGCFALTCGACATCYGGARDGDDPGILATVQLVARAMPTADDVLATLPPSMGGFTAGETFYVELWTQVTGATEGLAAVYVDVAYDARRVVVEAVNPSTAFPLFQNGVVDAAAGVVAAVGGCATLGEGTLGTGGTWARVATLAVYCPAPAVADVPARQGRVDERRPLVLQAQLAEPPYGVALFNRGGDLGESQLELGTLRLIVGHALPEVMTESVRP